MRMVASFGATTRAVKSGATQTSGQGAPLRRTAVQSDLRSGGGTGLQGIRKAILVMYALNVWDTGQIIIHRSLRFITHMTGRNRSLSVTK